jgi:hypothetical protein
MNILTSAKIVSNVVNIKKVKIGSLKSKITVITSMLVVVLLLTEPVAAATTWDPVFFPVATIGSQAINPSGLTAIAGVDSTSGVNILTVSLHSPTSGWTTSVAVSTIGENPAYPSVVVDATGVITVVYFDVTVTTAPVVKSVQYSGGVWSTPVVLPVPASDNQTRISGIGVTATNIVSVGISRLSARTVVGGIIRNTYSLEVYSLAPGGTWSPPSVAIGGSGFITQASFAMNSSGQAVAALGVLVSRSDAIGSWSPVVSIAPPATSRLPPRHNYGSATIDTNGKGYIPIAMADSLGNPTDVMLWTSTTGTTWTGAVQPALKGFSTLMIAGTSANNAVAAGIDTSLSIKAFRTSDGGQNWIGKTTLGTASTKYDYVSVSGSESGAAAVGFTQNSTKFYVSTLNSKNTWSTSLMKGGLLGDYYGVPKVTGNYVAYLASVYTATSLQLQAATGKIQ